MSTIPPVYLVIVPVPPDDPLQYAYVTLPGHPNTWYSAVTEDKNILVLSTTLVKDLVSNCVS